MQIESEKLLIKKEKKYRPLIRSEMVFCYLHRNGQQAERNEAEFVEFEEGRARNNH